MSDKLKSTLTIAATIITIVSGLVVIYTRWAEFKAKKQSKLNTDDSIYL